MNLNNYFKIEMPFRYNKNGYKFSGTSIVIFQYVKEENAYYKVFDTAILEGEVIGAKNFIDAPGANGYANQNNQRNREFWELRMRAFEKSEIKQVENNRRKKGKSKLLIDLEELNTLFRKWKYTTKNISKFITGANPTGGLRNPENDPLIAKIKTKVHDINQTEINLDGWYYIHSMFSNLVNKKLNSQFIYQDKIDQIKTINLEEFFKYKIKLVTIFGQKELKESHIDFEEAFIQRNLNNIRKTIHDNIKIIVGRDYFSQDKGELTNEEQLISYLDMTDHKPFLKRIFRSAWMANIDKTEEIKDIDHIDELNPRFEKAHILGNAEAIDVLLKLKQRKEEEKLRKVVEILISGFNYVNIRNDIHSMIDEKNPRIKLTKEGRLKNISMKKEQFNKIKETYGDEIMDQFKTKERMRILNEIEKIIHSY